DAGQYLLTMEKKPDAATVFLKPPPFGVVDGQAKTIEAKFVPAAPATGTVVDADGRGIPGVKVRVALMEKERPYMISWTDVETDKEGRYTARNMPGPFQILL